MCDTGNESFLAVLTDNQETFIWTSLFNGIMACGRKRKVGWEREIVCVHNLVEIQDSRNKDCKQITLATVGICRQKQRT